jgi:hypothetical protein
MALEPGGAPQDWSGQSPIKLRDFTLMSLAQIHKASLEQERVSRERSMFGLEPSKPAESKAAAETLGELQQRMLEKINELKARLDRGESTNGAPSESPPTGLFSGMFISLEDLRRRKARHEPVRTALRIAIEEGTEEHWVKAMQELAEAAISDENPVMHAAVALSAISSSISVREIPPKAAKALVSALEREGLAAQKPGSWGLLASAGASGEIYAEYKACWEAINDVAHSAKPSAGPSRKP